MMTSNPHTAFVGIGSNVGDRINYIREAVNLISSDPKVEVISVSSIYETLPFGNKNQQNFYNAVIKLHTSLSHQELHQLLKITELKLGRLYREHWGPREIDLDILLFDDLILSDDNLTLPHTGMHLRDFVLLPLSEIDKSVIHPVIKLSVSELLNQIKERTVISKIDEKILVEEKDIE